MKLNHSRWMFIPMLFGSAAAAFATDIPIKSTGQTVANGQDQNYKITMDGTIKVASGPAFIVNVNPNAKPTALPIGWGTNNPSGLWIGTAVDQSNTTRLGTCCVGDTIYRTDFSLTGLEPSTSSLTLQVLADDWVTVYLNGSDQAHVVYSPPEVMYLSPVTIQIQSGFVADNNFLEFHVHNAGGPTGLNVSATGTAGPIVSGPPILDISKSVYLTAVQGSPFSAADTAPVWVRNIGGGGPQPLQFSLADSPQCHSYNKDTFFALHLPTTTQQLAPAFSVLGFGTNPVGVPLTDPGFYRINFHLTSGALSGDVCVKFLLTGGPIPFSLSKTGLVFNAQAKTGTQNKQTVSLFAGAGRVDWTVITKSQNDFLIVTPPGGSATSAAGATTTPLTVSVKAMTDPGIYYGLIAVQPQTPGLPTQLVTVVYNVTPDAPLPELSTSGLIFTVPAGSNANLQTLSLLPSTSGSQPFTLTGTGGFLTLTNPTGSLGGSAATSVPIGVNTSQLHPGLNNGSLTLTVNGVKRTLDVKAILLPGAGAKCHASQIAAVNTSVAGGSVLTAGSPAVFQTRVMDDCGNPVTDAKVMLDFASGEPDMPAGIEDSKTGAYTATWTPAVPGTFLVTARASSGNFAASTTTMVTVVAGTGPILMPHGTSNNFNAQPETPIAPGTMAAIPGSNLATTSAVTGPFPLLTSFQGTKVTIAGTDVPIFSIDPAQIVVQIPVELASGQSYPLVVTVNGAVSAPDSVMIADVSPGLAVNPDGTLNAQHMDMTPVTADNPAVPGETIIAMGSGFGATSPAVATNTLAPADEPLARLVNPATVTVDLRTANPANPADTPYQGLAPGGIGLYQIWITIPPGTDPTILPANLMVLLTQNGQKANVATVPVGPALATTSSVHERR